MASKVRRWTNKLQASLEIDYLPILPLLFVHVSPFASLMVSHSVLNKSFRRADHVPTTAKLLVAHHLTHAPQHGQKCTVRSGWKAPVTKVAQVSIEVSARSRFQYLPVVASRCNFGAALCTA